MDLAGFRASADDAHDRARVARAEMLACQRRCERLSEEVAPMLRRGRQRAEAHDAVRREQASATALVATLALPVGALRPLPGAPAER